MGCAGRREPGGLCVVRVPMAVDVRDEAKHFVSFRVDLVD